MRITCRASFAGATPDPRRVAGVKLLQDDGGRKHHDGDEDRGDRGREHRSRPVGRLEDRQRDEAGVRHRCGPALHRRAGEAATAQGASEREDKNKADERAAAEGDQEAPGEQRARRLLGDGDHEQGRHRDIVGEVNQSIGKVARDIAHIAGRPPGHDHGKDGQDESSDLHPLTSDRPPRSRRALLPAYRQDASRSRTMLNRRRTDAVGHSPSTLSGGV